jgi:lysyl-tRNA synthetase class 1
MSDRTKFVKDALESRAWPFLEAQRILERINHKTPEKGYVLFETGYGPSGLPHIGTFGEVARTTMVRKAFQLLSDIPTRLFCFSDDMDGLRKVPGNIPNQEMVAQHMGKPLTSIPDPFGEKESFGHYMNAKLRSFLDAFNFEYEFQSATEWYKSGEFDHMLLRVLEKYDEVKNVVMPTLGDERQATYSPFLPVCPKTGRVLQAPVVKTNLDKGTITYKDEDGTLVEVPVTGGHCKLQWKPDFGMRWAAIGVDYEMYGKDHLPNAQLYSRICSILGGNPPSQYFFELFLGEDGAKISKSKGNGITVDEWLKYAPVESMALFMHQSPNKAKRLYFDVIPKNVDEYITFNRKYFEEQDGVKKYANPVFHIHGGDVPRVETYGLTYTLLLNLASACNPDDKSVLWGFISKYAPQATPENSPFLNRLAEFAVQYYHDFVKANKLYRAPTDEEKTLLEKVQAFLETLKGQETPEEIQSGIYAIGTDAGYENLRDFFKALYEILLGQSEGPRLGSFIALYGKNETIEMINRVLKS